MKTTIQIKHLRPRSTDGFDPYRNTEWYSKEEINKILDIKENNAIMDNEFKKIDIIQEIKKELFGDV